MADATLRHHPRGVKNANATAGVDARETARRSTAAEDGRRRLDWAADERLHDRGVERLDQGGREDRLRPRRAWTRTRTETRLERPEVRRWSNDHRVRIEPRAPVSAAVPARIAGSVRVLRDGRRYVFPQTERWKARAHQHLERSFCCPGSAMVSPMGRVGPVAGFGGLADLVACRREFVSMTKPLPLVAARYRTGFAEPRPEEAVNNVRAATGY